MKIPVWLLYLIITLMSYHQMLAQNETVELLPIQLIEGYGPFNPGFSPIDNSSKESSLWAKTYSDVKGIPTHCVLTPFGEVLPIAGPLKD